MSERIIHKYALSPLTAMVAPPGRVLHVGLDARGEPAVWIEHDLPVSQDWRRYSVVCTGQTIDPAYEYVGTFVLPAEGFVGHVYRDGAA